MKKLHLLVLAFIGLASITSYSTVYAENVKRFAGSCISNCGLVDRAKAITVTVAGGELFLASKRNMENPGVALLMAGYDFTQHWGIEGLAGFYNTHFKDNEHDKRQINGNIYAIDALYHFSPLSVFEPYVLAGVGAIGMNPNRNDANNEGNINAGLGFKVFFHPVVAFRVEARDFYTWVGGKNDVMLDGGVTFLFDLC
jgi:OmpA-OmpF porin, OOP family